MNILLIILLILSEQSGLSDKVISEKSVSLLENVELKQSFMCLCHSVLKWLW